MRRISLYPSSFNFSYLGVIMMDFLDQFPQLDDDAILSDQKHPLQQISLVLIDNGIEFSYIDDVVICPLKERTQEEIINTIRSNIPFSLLLLKCLVSMIRQNDSLVFRERNIITMDNR